VNADNAYGLLRESEVDGVLVGGASVKINQFKGVVQAAAEVLEAQQ
jgi:triosephosphate isomerase